LVTSTEKVALILGSGVVAAFDARDKAAALWEDCVSAQLIEATTTRVFEQWQAVRCVIMR
jgi:hypothetical protein